MTDNSKNKKVLILGGLGLLGFTLAQRLARRGLEVIVVDKKSLKKKLLPKISYIQTDALNSYEFRKLILAHRPNIIVNAINIATIFSHKPEKNYQRLIRFYYRLYRIIKKMDSEVLFIQLGTTGSGGLGFNIPFTHGDKIEDLPIINKAAFAGISTSMLILLSRSFDKNVKIAEIKPGLAIFKEKVETSEYQKSNLVVIDGGESGFYTYNELALLTRFMGSTTVDKIIDKVMILIDGKKNIHKHCIYDVVESLNNSVISSDSADKYELSKTIRQMKKMSGKDFIIATGELGPPSITRDLMLSYIKVKFPGLKKSKFESLLDSDMNIKNTLSYIQSRKLGLYEYLKKELNYYNYKHIPNYYKEPWENVAYSFGDKKLRARGVKKIFKNLFIFKKSESAVRTSDL